MGPSLQGTYKAYIHTWDTTVDDKGENSSVGHTSIELKNCGSESTATYLSLRPKRPWAVNPLTLFFPVTGKSVPSMEEDIEHEDSQPDKTTEISLNKWQFKEMQAKAESFNQDIAGGFVRYQLLANCSPLLWIAKALSTPEGVRGMGENPMTGELPEDDRSEYLKDMRRFQSSNCSCSVNDVLVAGGVSSAKKNRPWGISPSELADYLERSSGEKLS